MLRLTLESGGGPRWLDLPHGIRVRVRPLTTAIAEAAYAEALERTRPLKRAAEEAEQAGVPLNPAGPNAANPSWLQGLQWQWLCEALARYGIEAWEGIGDVAGRPLPVTPAALAAFAAHPDLGRAFFAAYRAALDAVDAEGNASAPCSAGDGAGAPPRTAAAARDGAATTSPAPAAPPA